MDRDGRVAAVRCRAALDVGVEAVYVGAAPGYKLEKTAQASKTVDETAGDGGEGSREDSNQRGVR